MNLNQPGPDYGQEEPNPIDNYGGQTDHFPQAQGARDVFGNGAQEQ